MGVRNVTYFVLGVICCNQTLLFGTRQRILVQRLGKLLQKETGAMIENDFYLDDHDMTLEEVKDLLIQFERKYGMASKQFAEKWKKGEASLVAESVPWITLFESYRAMNGYDNNQVGPSSETVNLCTLF
jgi:hypothetical protein